ncbi:MAG: hypothetical protein WC479_11625 [Candidatus Izemoplasmatales bacterium]|jgi:hypothetical protein
MALGAVTATYVGEAANGSAALKALFDSVNVGSATAGAETTSIIVIPTGGKVSVWKYARAAA